MTFEQVRAILTSVLLPTFVAVGVIALLGYGLLLLSERRPLKGTVAFMIAFAALGVTTGFVTGNSREPTVDAMLPAFLTLVSGLLTYVFTKEGLREWRPIIPSCVSVVVVGGLVGLALGASTRKAHDDFNRDYAKYLLHYQYVELELEKARYLASLDVWKQQQLQGATQSAPPVPPPK